jgi:hypothetical protein
MSRSRSRIDVDLPQTCQVNQDPPQTLPPATLWPPGRTATSSALGRAKLTAATTSAVLAHRAIRAGRLACMPLKA